MLIPFHPRRIRHHVHACRSRLKIECQLQCLGLRWIADYPRHAGDLATEQCLGGSCGDEDNREVWKQLGAIAQREVHRRPGIHNHGVESPIAEFRPDEVAQRGIRRRAELFGLQELCVVVDVDGRVRQQGAPERCVEPHVPGKDSEPP